MKDTIRGACQATPTLKDITGLGIRVSEPQTILDFCVEY